MNGRIFPGRRWYDNPFFQLLCGVGGAFVTLALIGLLEKGCQ